MSFYGNTKVCACVSVCSCFPVCLSGKEGSWLQRYWGRKRSSWCYHGWGWALWLTCSTHTAHSHANGDCSAQKVRAMFFYLLPISLLPPNFLPSQYLFVEFSQLKSWTSLTVIHSTFMKASDKWIKSVHSCSLHLSSYIRTHARTHSLWLFALMSKRVWLVGEGGWITWQTNCRMIFPWAVGGMDGRMTPISIPTGKRKSLSEHNRKETERKQAHVFMDIKSLPVGLWAASPTIFSLHFATLFNLLADRGIDQASLSVCRKWACSCAYISHMSQITHQ